MLLSVVMDYSNTQKRLGAYSCILCVVDVHCSWCTCTVCALTCIFYHNNMYPLFLFHSPSLYSPSLSLSLSLPLPLAWIHVLLSVYLFSLLEVSCLGEAGLLVANTSLGWCGLVTGDGDSGEGLTAGQQHVHIKKVTTTWHVQYHKPVCTCTLIYIVIENDWALKMYMYIVYLSIIQCPSSAKEITTCVYMLGTRLHGMSVQCTCTCTCSYQLHSSPVSKSHTYTYTHTHVRIAFYMYVSFTCWWSRRPAWCGAWWSRLTTGSSAPLSTSTSSCSSRLCTAAISLIGWLSLQWLLLPGFLPLWLAGLLYCWKWSCRDWWTCIGG